MRLADLVGEGHTKEERRRVLRAAKSWLAFGDWTERVAGQHGARGEDLRRFLGKILGNRLPTAVLTAMIEVELEEDS